MKKGSVFQLIDNYTLFFFQFVQGYAGQDEHRWSNMSNDQRRRTWEGLAFERVCLQHSRQIKAVPNSYVVNDDTEMGIGNKIPLWLFGFLY